MEVPNSENLQTRDNQAYSATKVLQTGEESLESYNRFIVNSIYQDIQNFVGNKKSDWNLCDFGAGVGTLAQIFRETHKLNPVCVELDPSQRVILQNRGFRAHARLEDSKSNFDYVFTSNVLEHIEYDVEALKTIAKALNSKGRLAIYVPALPILFSDLDRRVGHYRRYKKRELIAKVELAGFRVDSCYYNDSIGVLAGYLVKFFGFKPESGLGSKGSFLIYDKLVFPLSKILDRLLFKHLLGKNLFLFAEKLD